jgi:hypothetical protein
LREAQSAVYVPTVEGTALRFEAFALENGRMGEGRLELRVLSTKRTEDGLEVAYSITTLRGISKVTLLCQQDGGIFHVMPDGSKNLAFPPGFPDKTTSWQADGVNYQVLGRTRASFAGIELQDPIGVWVEAIAASPSPSPLSWGRARMLVLPGIGEAESKVLHDGNWVTVSRLVGVAGAAAESI